jgi:dTMP kinase
MTRGVFVSLDGLDGCGKSTQCRLLVDWLRARAHRVTSCREPGGTALGEQLRSLLLEKGTARSPVAEALLFIASRAQLVDEIIAPALDQGQIVVSDRFSLATVVYQGYAGGLDPKELGQVSRFATGGIEPDLTVVLDLPVEAARARLTRPADRIESRDNAYHQRVRDGFLLEARRCPQRIHIVDATQAPDAVHAAITQEVTRVLETHSRT